MTHAVEARQLVFRYSARTALADSSFQMESGNVIALIGPNGSGKSTLLDAIAALHTPAAGDLEVLGGPPRRARRELAYALQATKVNETLPVTVREIFTMGPTPGSGCWAPDTRRPDAVEAALDREAIADLAERSLSELSSGERQRAFVVQGLAQDHCLLLLDEPLTWLDLVSSQVILSVLDEERGAWRYRSAPTTWGRHRRRLCPPRRGAGGRHRAARAGA